MKKLNVNALLTVLVVVLSVGLIAALIKDNSEKEYITETTTEITTHEEITTENKIKYNTNIEKKINEEIKKKESEEPQAWKKAYIDFLKGYYDENGECRFDLGYVDDNDIPELFISEGSFHYCTVEVYTFSNNTVNLLCETGSNGMINYFEREGILCGYYSGMGVSSYYVYKIDDGKTEIIYYAFSNEFFSYGMDNEEDFDEVITINNIDVTSEEFNDFTQAYFYNNVDIDLFDIETDDCGYSLNEYNIEKYISNF